MNTSAYIIYLLLTYFITVRVGMQFYRNGRIYILAMLRGDQALSDFINKILLTGYYLLNLGYATVMIFFWKTITSTWDLVASIAGMTGKIMLTLAIIHFFNMGVIFFISKKSNPSFFNHKT